MEHYDLIVIGAGSGGIATAARAAQHGAKCAIIENKLPGGTCVNVGCVPKKIMWYAANLAESLHHANQFGLNVSLDNFNFNTLIGNQHKYIARIHGFYDNYLSDLNIDFIQGTAHFIDSKIVNVEDKQYTAKHILIASGCRPAIPTIPGAEHGIDSDGFFALKALPKKCAVVGAGYIAVELAGVLHALGCDTHLILRKDKPLRTFDPMLSDALLEISKDNGLSVHTHHTPTSLKKEDDDTLTLQCDNQDALKDFDCVLWAIGREPETSKLDLAKTGLSTNEKGFIESDQFENTAVDGIYAIGDITGKIQLTPVAIAAGRKLAGRLFNHQTNAHLDYSNVPSVVFTHPPIASIGATEPQARKIFGDTIKIYSTKFTPMVNAIAGTRTPCHMKLITEGDNETVIGCHMIGVGVDEMLQGVAVAIKMKATKQDFDNTVAIHPTSSEELVLLK
jgi:glutathione reductase (NADPH)